MKKVYILRGCSGSGKTTERLKITRNKKCNIISWDDMRKAFFTNYSFNPYNEKMIQQIAIAALERFLISKEDIIIDNTNLNPEHIKPFIETINFYKKSRSIQILWIDLTNIPLKTLLLNNSKKENPIPIEAIKKQFNKLTRFKDFYNQINESPNLIINDINKPSCKIFDLDGTLALKSDNRSYYDTTNLIDDEVNDYVLNLYNDGTEEYRIICTARTEECKDETLAWLELHDIVYDEILFRGNDDKRPDYLVKEDMWRIIVKHYNILSLVDDRVSVINHARKLGLNVFAVNNKYY